MRALREIFEGFVLFFWNILVAYFFARKGIKRGLIHVVTLADKIIRIRGTLTKSRI